MINDIPPFIPEPDLKAENDARHRLRNQARPAGSLGMLEELATRLAAVTGCIRMNLDNRYIVTCAGDHGVVEEGVSLFPQEVTSQMVHNFVAGGASINVLARHADATVEVADLGVNADFPVELPIFHKKVAKGTANFALAPAMSREQAVQSIHAGMEIVNELRERSGIDLLGTGDMGIGNTTPSTAMLAAFTGKSPAELAGRGTGLDDDGLEHKIRVIDAALAKHAPDAQDPVDVLTKVGGFEIGGIAGLILGAASQRIPVIIDGLISTAGAVLACELAPRTSYYLFAGHRSVERAHTVMLNHLNLTPLLDMGLRLGEGTGSALAMEMLTASTRVLSDVRTFEEVAIRDAQQRER